jgi:lysophospholipase L1-like esterase
VYDYTSLDYYQAAFDEQNLVVERLAEEMNTYFYDFAADMPLDEEYWGDGRHMTAKGNRLRAELIAAYLDENGVIPHP